jgi:hypothetical protein
MQFEKDNSGEKIGQKAGFLFSYLVFTIAAYFILSLTNRLPDGWTYVHVGVLTFAIVLAGFSIKKLLK